MGKKPDWIKVRAPNGALFNETMQIVRQHKLTTVCEEAGCPNIGECWQKKHATFMIMGEVCTRACAFCNVATGKPNELDRMEPLRVGVAVSKMGLKHVVITSVDRDDLDDGGADHYVKTIGAIRFKAPGTTVEILTGDFRGSLPATDHVIAAKPDVFNHNLETVPRLYPTVRPGARFFRSLRLLQRVKDVDPTIFTKSGLMVGLGETKEEVGQVMDDMRAADIDFLTVGQYLQPSPKHAPVDRFWTPEEFEQLEKTARAKGFLMVSGNAADALQPSCGRGFRAAEKCPNGKDVLGRGRIVLNAHSRRKTRPALYARAAVRSGRGGRSLSGIPALVHCQPDHAAGGECGLCRSHHRLQDGA